MKAKAYKDYLQKIADTIPQIVETSETNNEKILAMLVLMTQYLESLNELAEDSTDPDFDENLQVLRLKIFDLMTQIINAAVENV